MRLWVRYLREKRLTLALYFVTVFLFVAVGSLYHIENLEKFLYAAVMTTGVWAILGVLDGIKYVQKSRKLEAVFRHCEQSGEVLLGEAEEVLRTASDSVEGAESYADALAFFLQAVNGRQGRERQRWEEKTVECRDYYLMWTHQIKTPIAAMKLLFDRLELSDRDSFLMREELFKIEQYVEMVLAFQRLEGIADDLVLQEYDLGSLVRQAVKKYSVLFINKGLRLELGELDFGIITDEKWFVFCLEQLLSNSIKYTAKGGIVIRAMAEREAGAGMGAEEIPEAGVEVSTGAEELTEAGAGVEVSTGAEELTEAGAGVEVSTGAGELPEAESGARLDTRAAGKEQKVLLTLEDTGIGIRAEDLPRIFERGFTGYNGRLDKRSTGIGLYLCRRVYTQLGITVQVESEDGQGTKVTLGIPCAGERRGYWK